MGIDEVKLFVKGEANTKATCKAAVVAVENDVKTIISSLKSIHGVKDLVAKIIDDVLLDGEDIFGELSAAGKAYGLADYFGSGRQLGMAFRRLLVGGPPAPPTPSPAPTHCNVGDAVQCPHLATWQMCAGNQCCPDGSTCPSADNSFKGCQKPKTQDCTSMQVIV